PPGRRDDFVDRYFRRAQPDQVVAIIKAREPATIMTAIGKDDRWHLEMKRRWVEQYNFYVHDSRRGQMFVRVCPYFPFSARFCRRAAVDALDQRLLDANRTIGQPNKLTVIFGRRITRRHGDKLQTVIEDLNLPNPVIRSHYRKGFLKQYVRDRFLLRTESATNNISTDYGIGKAVENLPELRMRLHGIIDRYLEVQQDILETFVDREELRQLTQPTLLP